MSKRTVVEISLAVAATSVALTLSACATRVLRIDQVPTENRIGPNDVVAVHFDGPRPVVESQQGLKSLIQWDTTAEWDSVFAGAEDATWKFRLTHSQLRVDVAAMGFAMRATYDVQGTLTDGKHIYTVTGSGSRAAAAAVIGATRQAVELAIVSAAQHCKSLIAQTPANAVTHG